MNGTNTTIKKVAGTSTLVKPKFGPGMLLQHEDLEQLSAYTRDLNRLMFRSFFGCGVVCGLVVVTSKTKCDDLLVTVGCGLALDCSGDPVYVPRETSIEIDPVCIPDEARKLWVVLCGIAKSCSPRASMCASEDDEGSSVSTRERAGFEIRIVTARDCACGCPEPDKDNATLLGGATPIQPPPFRPAEGPCYDDHYAGICKCDCGECCECTCVLLASLEKIDNALNLWRADHKVRRGIRPVLMRDKQIDFDTLAANNAALAKKKVDEQEQAVEELRTTREALQESEEALRIAEAELKEIRAANEAKNAEAAAAESAAPKKQKGVK
jgi:hypothetical protein